MKPREPPDYLGAISLVSWLPTMERLTPLKLSPNVPSDVTDKDARSIRAKTWIREQEESMEEARCTSRQLRRIGRISMRDCPAPGVERGAVLGMSGWNQSVKHDFTSALRFFDLGLHTSRDIHSSLGR